MSETVFKMVVRGHIPEFDGKSSNDVIGIFREKLGEPDEVDEDEGVVSYFSYGEDHFLVPIFSYDEKKWGLEHLLDSSDGEAFDVALNYGDIKMVEDRMKQLFPSIQTVNVFAYSWYTGVDEPVRFV